MDFGDRNGYDQGQDRRRSNRDASLPQRRARCGSYRGFVLSHSTVSVQGAPFHAWNLGTRDQNPEALEGPVMDRN
jgi:hypothetical protein